MAAKAYLWAAMLRRLLTCLALITGLAATGTPAHAGLIAAATGVEMAQRTEKPCKAQECGCNGQRQAGRQGAPAQPTPCPTPTTITIVIPTVMLGSDRAYE